MSRALLRKTENQQGPFRQKQKYKMSLPDIQPILGAREVKKKGLFTPKVTSFAKK